jgi:4-hydroxybenzoate polyprenyltransferase
MIFISFYILFFEHMNYFKKILDIYRFLDWYYYLGFLLLGLCLRAQLNITIFKYFLLSAFLLAYAFSFNDFCDKRKKAYFILPLFLSILFFPLLNITQIILSSIFLLIVIFYSAKPLRLKAKPFFSSLCNGVGFSIIFLLGYSVISFDVYGFIFSLFLFCFNMIAQLIHEVVDIDEDKKENITTTAVLCGERRIIRFCQFFLSMIFLIGAYLYYLKIVGFIFLIITMIFSTFFMFKISRKRIDKNLRKNYKIFGILVGLIYFILICVRNI